MSYNEISEIKTEPVTVMSGLRSALIFTIDTNYNRYAPSLKKITLYNYLVATQYLILISPWVVRRAWVTDTIIVEW